MANRQRKSAASQAAKPPVIELCAASYKAEQIPGTVIITATGIHPTTGYSEFFQQSPIDVFPPEFTLFHQKPSGITLPALTPFSVTTHFHATSTVKQVVLHDADGRHVIPVEEAPDAVASHFTDVLAKDGPFPMTPASKGRKRPAQQTAHADSPWLHLRSQFAAEVTASGVVAPWARLKPILVAWSGKSDIQFGDSLSGLWDFQHAPKPFDPFGIKALLDALGADPVLGPCLKRLGVGPGDFKSGGGIQTVEDLLNKTKACS